MVSGWSILFMFLNGILCIGIPIGGYLYFRVKPVRYIGIFIAGALSFYLTQMVVRIPILQLALPKMEWYVNLAGKEGFLYPVGIALFLGGTAALFETFGRFITLNYLLQKRLSYRSGIIHGLGHGGIEAILLVGLNHLIYGGYSLMLNAGNANPMTAIVPMEQQQVLKDILVQTPSDQFFAAGFERVMTIFLHVALSLLVTVGIVKGKKWLYILIVFFAHMFVDASVVIAGNYTNSVWVLEAMIFVYGMISLIVVWKLKGTINDGIDIEDATKAVEEGY